jgi:hypothetical protein
MIFASIFFIPFILLIYLSCCMKDDAVVSEEKKGKPNSKSNREKLD